MNVMALWAAVLCAVVAAWLLCGPDPALRRARLIGLPGGRPERGVAGMVLARGRALLAPLGAELGARTGVRLGREVLCLPVGLALAVAGHSAVPALAGLVAVPLVGRRLRERERYGAADRRSAAVEALCGAVAGDLRAGLAPHTALAGAIEYGGWPGRPGTAEAATCLLAAARFGGDVPAALREAARQPGAEGLSGVAACWQVAVDGGAGLADGLDRIAAALRAERDQREELRAQLAGPRSTALMLALLPAFGVVLGVGMGADPLRVLLRTPAGIACLTAGIILECAGLAWTTRIARSAEEAP